MKKLLKTFVFLFCTLYCVSTNAYDFQSGGIYYNILSQEELTCEVAPEYEGGSSYSGYIIVPELVSYRWSTDYTVVAIGNAAFSGCQLDGISLPTTIKRIGNEAFNGCKGLSSLGFPQAVEYIGDYAFNGSDFGGSLTIPSSCKYVGNSAFFETNITDLTFEMTGSVNFNNLCIIGDVAFGNCDMLWRANLNGLFYHIGNNPFMRCDNLTEIEGWGGYTNQEETQGNLLIDGCLYSFTENGGVRYLSLLCCPSGRDSYTSPNDYTGIEKKQHRLTSLGKSSFAGCSKITNLEIPNTVKVIYAHALFMACDVEDTEYRRVNIPESVELIESFAFGWFSYNWDIYIHSTKIENFSPGTYPSDGRKYGTVHIPYGTKSSFVQKNPNLERAFDILDDIGAHEEPVTLKCAKPSITYKNGKILFTCETPDVKYVYSICTSGESTNGTISLGGTFTISAYTTREGYENSETTTISIDMLNVGDVNGDGVITISDIVALVNIILGKN